MGKEKHADIKRPMSAYLYFVNANRDKMKAANPGVDNKGLMSVAGVEWGKLTAEQKAPYEAQAKEAKDAFVKAGGPALVAAARKAKAEAKAAKGGKGGKGGKSKGHPHKPNAYSYFVSKNRPLIIAANPSATFAEVSRLLGDKWRDTPEEKKEEYRKLAEAGAGGGGGAAAKSKPAPKPAAKAEVVEEEVDDEEDEGSTSYDSDDSSDDY